jgi:hypothetical protein
VAFGCFALCLHNADRPESDRSYSGLGYSYENGTGIPGREVLAPDPFKVKEVEVFEIID